VKGLSNFDTVGLRGALAFILGFLGIGHSACQEPLQGAHSKSPLFHQTLKTMLKAKTPSIDVGDLQQNLNNYLVLDAREEPEYQISHLFGAKYLGYDQPKWDLLAKTPKNTPIAVYCSVGYRSEKILEKLQEMGYTNVYNVYGSIFEWVNRGYPVYRGAEPVSEVHGYSKLWSVWILKKDITVRY
jgi:rhodanese-related sulfurtransferase